MPGTSWWEGSPGLRTVFGSIVASAQAGASTAEVWDAIRSSAANVATQTLSVTLGTEPSDAQVSDAVNILLKGVGAAQVSQARGAAGQLVAAHGNLMQLGTDQQITAEAVGLPPWATTVNAAGVQVQYRIRVLREITVHGFTAITRQEWASYNLSGPLTTIATALDQANTLFTGAEYNNRTDINSILDYTIEAV